jgi:MraZ protein
VGCCGGIRPRKRAVFTAALSVNAAAPVLYNSIYRHGVDEKRRLQIPAKWRPSEEGFQFTVILLPSSATKELYLLVLPPEPLSALLEKLKAMPYMDPKADSLRRLLGKNSDQAVMDKAGRICVPELMARGAGIEREAVLIGSWDRFEIWNPDRYEAANRVDEAMASEAFKLI